MRSLPVRMSEAHGRRRRGSRCGWALLLGIWLGCAFADAAQPAGSVEYGVKAGYLFHFAKFVEWPTNCAPAAGAPFLIGVLDGEESFATLAQVLAHKSVNGHPVEVKALQPGEAVAGLHVLFVPRTADLSPRQLRSMTGRAATLIVGEADHFAENGGVINFVHRGGNIRLEINLKEAEARGLRISSQLATVATLVNPGPRP